MEFKNVLETRRSIRKFKSTKVEDDLIRKILQLAQLAPSAGDLQAYRVRIVKLDDVKRKLKRATMSKQESITSAPVVLIICANLEESKKVYGKRGEDLYAVQDATIFASYLQLAMTEAGLTSVWVGAFSEEEVRNVLSLPANLRPIIMLPFGYPAERPHARDRKDLENIIA